MNASHQRWFQESPRKFARKCSDSRPEKLRIIERQLFASAAAFQKGRKVVVRESWNRSPRSRSMGWCGLYRVWIGPHDEYGRLIKQQG